MPLWRSLIAEGQRFEQRALQRDPVRRGVHFVFGEFEFAGADIFVGEEFDFLEADDLRANQHVAVRARRRNFRLLFAAREPAAAISSTRTCV